MKTVFVIFFALLLGVLLMAGCQPVRCIAMRNETADTVKFTWTLREDSLLFNPFFLYNSNELTFLLAPQKNNSVKLSFGSGGWSPGEVQKLSRQLESLQISSPAQHIKIDSLDRLKDFLLAHRKGMGSTVIEIAINK